MPTYEYACRKCGILEVFQSIKADPLTTCPTCKAKGFQRMVSRGAGVIFKGSGFWETDYNRGADYEKKAKSDQSAATVPTPTPTPEAKPQPKAEPKAEPKPATAPAAAAKPDKSDKPAAGKPTGKPAKS